MIIITHLLYVYYLKILITSYYKLLKVSRLVKLTFVGVSFIFEKNQNAQNSIFR